ncbi:MAG: Na/Pi cotransporter family protein [Oscillospiraceae bacterium]|nr:Na/Pi cotransporter family protein [Oscillospiraceae bacterium]
MNATAWDLIQSIFLVFGGLGLFLYGMKMMSDGLESMAGDRMRVVLERATSNRFAGIAVGAGVTCVIQSSSATTVMVVGFVNAGLMTLTQAIGVIMGANIGTTITAQMISFKIDPIAPLFIFIGLVLHLFVKKRSVKNLGMILLGFGVLFFGISVMGAPLKEFAKQPGFQSILTTFRNPLLSLLAGLVFTAVIQSSSATTGIIVALYLGGVDLPFTTAAFLVLGSNIGTCVTAALASIAASRESKRAALSHVLFNTVGCVVFGALITIFPGILTWIQQAWPDGARQVAMFHTLFNVSTVVLLVPFIKQLALLVQKIIPEKQGENANAKRLIYLDPGIMQTPAIAVAQAHRELCRMGEMALGNLRLALEAFYEKDAEKGAAALEVEDTLNFLNHQITAWLVRIRGLNLSAQDLEKLSLMLRTVSDIERVGDHAENIAEYAMLEGKYATKFSAAAMEELRAMSETALQLVALALEIFEAYDEALLPQVDPLERVVDRMAKDFVETHIKRLKAGDCDPRSGVVFTDMVTDLERCADHATNIAYSILGEKLREAG